MIADGPRADIKGEATILSHFRDPAVLIDTVEQAIPLKGMQAASLPAARNTATVQTDARRTILILDLKHDVSDALIEAIGRHDFSVIVNSGFQESLDAAKQVQPVLMRVYSDIDEPLQDLLSRLKMNPHTKTIPLAIIADNPHSSQLSGQFNLGTTATTFSIHMGPSELARRLTAMVPSR